MVSGVQNGILGLDSLGKLGISLNTRKKLATIDGPQPLLQQEVDVSLKRHSSLWACICTSHAKGACVIDQIEQYDRSVRIDYQRYIGKRRKDY
jgi:hypothetical protein